ncbi:CCA tRNA nucleotidyltransferase [Deinococcus lacus]|uniref:CCA tRNA nucleotidyltransferase n=1 Tax=Deinococcus lacus TaxID=392561 RepID=A0ABW1Y979_9DEIO
MSAPAAPVWNALSEEDRAWLWGASLRLAAARPGAGLALVGGAVRDALLGNPVPPADLDVVVSGAALAELVPLLCPGAEVTWHPSFGNAAVRLSGGRSLDLIQARREVYPVPGQNPLPLPGTLADDLLRRDFSLNALALQVDAPGAALHLIDPAGGLADLAARQLRPLHALSLYEDASRLLRAARLAGRLGLMAHPELLAQVPAAVAMAPQTPRLWAEWRLLLGEPWPGRAAQALRAWGAEELALPGLGPLFAELDTWRSEGRWVPAAVYAAALLWAAGDQAELWGDRLGLGPGPLRLLQRSFQAQHGEGTPENLVRRLLRPDPYPPLSGQDLLALGFQPGPLLGEALRWLQSRRDQGHFAGREQEAAALLAWMQSRGLGGESEAQRP